MQINKFQINIYQVVSEEFLFTSTCSEKELTTKIWFLVTNNWIGLAVRRSVKYFFAPNFQLFQKCGREKKKKRGNCEAFCFSTKRNKALHASLIVNVNSIIMYLTMKIYSSYIVPWSNKFSVTFCLLFSSPCKWSIEIFWNLMSSFCCKFNWSQIRKFSCLVQYFSYVVNPFYYLWNFLVL